MFLHYFTITLTFFKQILVQKNTFFFRNYLTIHTCFFQFLTLKKSIVFVIYFKKTAFLLNLHKTFVLFFAVTYTHSHLCILWKKWITLCIT